ncbi:Rv0518 family GDSL lipase [Mycolicibacterium arenosum]|uniref:SGNH/GDSL hydrolase family protein n=1 Tax=Mycolicibacterium arenosum TaxID=2952157 RepID=A0ABT1M760_9MYCO|nr:GDSL lipase [Mycolicibacterium sp. CAU 1645]MCP9275014.1 SGNH/GDSL hydrolase family protein [Mycolicibacterium sp. CAU 1645]
MGRLAAFVAVVMVFTGVVVMPVPADYELAGREVPQYRIAVIGDSYTTGGDLGGRGAQGWTSRAWQLLARRGVLVNADVAAEGGAGYGVPGNRGNVYEALAARAIRPDDTLVVYFGSRNDQPANPVLLPGAMLSALGVASRTAPSARILVIGPPWPTADVPPAVLQVRDALFGAARLMGAMWIDPIAERWFVGQPDLIGRDGVHPTDAGHAYMAERIAPLIADALPTQT